MSKIGFKNRISDREKETNQAIRDACLSYGVPLWKVANEIGVSPTTLTRWMRYELKEEIKVSLLQAIKDIAKGGKA